MAQDITVPDLGDFKDVEVIDVLVKPGDKIDVDLIEPDRGSHADIRVPPGPA